MRAFLIAVLVCVASAAQAQTRQAPTLAKTFTESGEVYSSATLLSGSPVLTFSKLGQQYSKLKVQVFLTWAAASTITAAFECSINGTNYASDTTSACALGTCTHYIMADTFTTGGASRSVSFDFDVRACSKAKVTLGGAGATTDTVITASAGVVGL